MKKFLSIATAIMLSTTNAWGVSSRVITADVIKNTNGGAALNVPAVGVNIISDTATQTLTGKTISGSANTFSNIPAAAVSSGIFAIANGGTGQSSANAAFNALAPSQATHAGQYLSSDGTNTSWAPITGVSFPLFASNGSLGAPVYSFSADSTLGVYYFGTGAIGYSGKARFSDFVYSPNQKGYYGRDLANSADVHLISTDGNDRVNIGQSNKDLIAEGVSITFNNLDNSTDFNMSSNSNQFTFANRGNGSSGTKLLLFAGNNSQAITVKVPTSLSANWSLTLPPDAGTNGQVLTTNGSGVSTWTTVSGGSGANTALSNLITTDINQNFIFNTGGAAVIQTKNTAGVSQNLSVITGAPTVANVNSGDLNLGSGNVTGTGIPGAINITAGTMATAADTSINHLSRTVRFYGYSADQGLERMLLGVAGGLGSDSGYRIETSAASGGNVSQSMDFGTGDATAGTSSGGINIYSGPAATSSGAISIYSGTPASTGTSGGVFIYTSPAISTGSSGGVALDTGIVQDGTGGNITLSTHAPGGTGSRGDVEISSDQLVVKDNDAVVAPPLLLYNLGNTAYTGLKSVATSSVIYSLPPDDGTAGQFLQTDGSANLSWTTSAVTFPLLGPDGSAGAPTISFASDPDTGIWRGSSGTMIFTGNGSNVFAVAPNFIGPTGGGIVNGNHGSPWASTSANILDATNTGQVRIFNLANTQSVGFTVDAVLASSTLYQLPSTDGTSGQVLSTDGAGILSWAPAATPSYPLLGPDGSASTPTISFSSESNTGFYHPTSGDIAFSVAGTASYHFKAAEITPDIDGGANLGSSSKRFSTIWSDTFKGGGPITLNPGGTGNISIGDNQLNNMTHMAMSNIAGGTHNVHTPNTADNSVPSDSIQIYTGDNTGGNNSGDLSFLIGSVTGGGVRGHFLFDGHMHTTGAAPGVSACGTSPSIAGNDVNGRVTVGTGGVATSCTVTFVQAWATAPICTIGDESTSLLVTPAPTTTALVITAATPFGASDKLSYHCEGYQ